MSRPVFRPNASPWMVYSPSRRGEGNNGFPERAKKQGCSSVRQPAVKGAERAGFGAVGGGGGPGCRVMRKQPLDVVAQQASLAPR